MSRSVIRPAGIPQSLGRLRLRLTAWYVGTFFAILALLGIGIFATITRLFDRDLDESLRRDTHALAAMARAFAQNQSGATLGPMRLLRELRIPERALYIADSLGTSVTGVGVEPWMAAVARSAWANGTAYTSHHVSADRILRIYAERFSVGDGTSFVAMTSADEIEVEDRYTYLIAVAATAALVSLVLVAGGGWLLARQSTVPVERAIAHMRRFMADAAHELRTPLTVVRSRAEIALQQPRNTTEYQTALLGIEHESIRLSRIVEDLLMLARADAGERPLDRRRIFLDDVTLDAAEAARAIADRKAVRLEVDSFEEAPVIGDADLLRQLAMILLDNAIKYTNTGGVVRVGVRATQSQAVLTVSDSGVGISADQLPHVFERFYRGDPSRTRGIRDIEASEGAGLGLSIAQWIAEQHGGTIRINSTPDKGTAAHAQFPIASGSQELSSS